MDNWIFKYHEAIQKKEVIVGVWVRLCFEILTTGLLNGEWEFNEKKANKAIKFIENFCHHSEGRSDLLHLELWQKAIVSAIFGIMDKTTGYRQFREVFIIVARKNGKTLFAAAIAAYMTYVDGEYGAKVYFLAPKLDQADLVYDVFAAIGSWFGARWTEIKTALASVPTWFKTQFDNAWANIKNAFANATSFFSDLWEKIKGCFVNVGVAIGSAVGDAFKSAINSCLSTIEGVVNKFIGMINGVIGIINEIPGVSLSKIDTLSLPRLAKGGVLREGTAMVAEAGPELLSMVNGKAVVTPLTGSAVNTAADNLKGNNSGFHQEINITSPKALSPYEVARQTRIQTRAMVIAMQRG